MLTIGYYESDSIYRILEFDAVITEGHEVTATLTEHPVERGADLSDHKRPGPRMLRLEGLVTNTPLGALPLTGGLFEDITASAQGTGSGKAVVTTFSASFDRVTAMLDKLTALTEGADLLTIVTDVRTYEDAELVSVTAPRVAESGDAITFALEIVQVRIADTQEVGAPVARFPRGRRARDNGAQNPAEATGDTAAGRAQGSILTRIRDSEDTPEFLRSFLGGGSS